MNDGLIVGFGLFAISLLLILIIYGNRFVNALNESMKISEVKE